MVNYPPPKGTFEALLTMVQVIDEDGPISPADLAETEAVRTYGYSAEGGTTVSPGGKSQAYDELNDVLGLVTTTANHELRLTNPQEVTDRFLPDASGEGLATLLDSDSPREHRRPAITAFLLRKLNDYDMSIEDGTITNAFHEFTDVLWRQQESATGVYKSGWGPSNLIGGQMLSGAEWNPNKVKFVRDRAVALGVAKREYTSSRGDNLLPVVSMDALQEAIHLTYRYFVAEKNENSPEFEAFYEVFRDVWYPVPRTFYERHVLRRGPLAEGVTISPDTFPVLYDRLAVDDGPADGFEVRYLEAEKEWEGTINASEFEFEGVNHD